MPYLLHKERNGSTIQYWNLHAGPLVIGRGDEAEGKIDDIELSREHFVISKEEGAFHIKDLGSKNGTLVNNQAVSDQVLQPNDQIRLGAASLSSWRAYPPSQARSKKTFAFSASLPHPRHKCTSVAKTLASVAKLTLSLFADFGHIAHIVTGCLVIFLRKSRELKDLVSIPRDVFIVRFSPALYTPRKTGPTSCLYQIYSPERGRTFALDATRRSAQCSGRLNSNANGGCHALFDSTQRGWFDRQPLGFTRQNV